ncbi:hypothetical protein ARMGADRAFT_170843 [Armillaria gallica]|uniref:Uncharacterized protein n=1 Tax=Armillaria gallica TaxID=47427 RepID=A0A2H3DWN2_ARMGA|nr:hypothetical protein ARMGADRAFT_170843 [Armillaria gallica]
MLSTRHLALVHTNWRTLYGGMMSPPRMMWNKYDGCSSTICRSSSWCLAILTPNSPSHLQTSFIMITIQTASRTYAPHWNIFRYIEVWMIHHTIKTSTMFRACRTGKGTQTICIPLEMLRLYAAIDSVQAGSDEARHSALCLKATMRLTIQHEFSHYIVTNIHKLQNTPPRKSLTWATDDIYDTAVFEIQGGDGPLDSGFLTEIRLTRGRTELVRTQGLQLGRVVPLKVVERHLWELNPHLRKSTSTPLPVQPENNQVNQEDLESDSEADPAHDNIEPDSETDSNHVC